MRPCFTISPSAAPLLTAHCSDCRRRWNSQRLSRELRMAVCKAATLWRFMFLMAGAVAQTVIYKEPACAVRGSTVTLPCSFTPLKSFNDGGRNIPLRIVRVRWCQNHLICQGRTPSVYDSNSTENNPRYQYLGDKKTNCTLQVRDVQETDNTTFRFRMEADRSAGHFTNQTGVTVTVIGEPKMRINSSSDGRTFRGGENVTLLCTSFCSFHQLEVTWLKDGHALSESGPSLQLGRLTPEDSGNYTCALKPNNKTLSEPYSLHVEGGAGAGKTSVIAGVVFGVLLAVIILVLFLFFIKRKPAAAEDQLAGGGEMEHKHHDNIYSNIQISAQQKEEEDDHQQESSRDVEDISYATVQFKQKNQKERHVKEDEDAIIYSSVVS